jgi:Dolichyl-phosphate-mannose-protein mannosyltransferase
MRLQMFNRSVRWPNLRRLTMSKNVEFWIVLSIVILGLVLRLYAAGGWNADRPDSPQRLKGDEREYNSIALSIIRGDGFVWPGRVPLYPLWLAGAFRLTRGSYSGIPYVQSLLGITVIPLTYVLGRRIFGVSAGLLAAVLTAISYVLIHQSLHLLSEVLYTPFILLVAMTLWDALRQPSIWRFCWAGLWVGLSNLVRPTLLLFPCLLILALLILLPKRQAVRLWVVYVITAALVVMPWVIHNYIRYQALFPLQTSKAILWQSSPEYYHLVRDRGYTYRRVWSEVVYPPNYKEHDPTSVEGDRWWTQRALRSIVAEPLVYLTYAVEKLGTYWVGDPNADWGDTYVFNYQALLRVGYTDFDATLYMIARILPIVALLTSFALWRQWRVLLAIYALLVYCTLLHAATHAEARLSDPLQPLLLIIIGGAIATTFGSLADRLWLHHTRTARLSPVATAMSSDVLTGEERCSTFRHRLSD